MWGGGGGWVGGGGWGGGEGGGGWEGWGGGRGGDFCEHDESDKGVVSTFLIEAAEEAHWLCP